MAIVLLYAMLSSSFFYLGSRALVTSWAWRHYPQAFAKFMDCAACSGWWYGLILAFTLGRYADLDFFGLASHDLLTPIVVAFCSLVWTPIVAGVMQRGLDALGSAVE